MSNQFTVNELSKPHRNNNWRVEGILNGKRKRSFWRTRELADRAARKFNLELEREGHRLADIPNEIRAEALACVERLAAVAGATLTKAVEFFLTHNDLRAKSVPVAHAWATYIAHEEARAAGKLGKRIRPRTLESTRKAGRFAADFAGEQVCDLSSKRIQAWLDGLTREDGASFSAGSKQAYRLALSGFFSFCVKEEWISVHPIKGEKIHSYGSDEDHRPGILVPNEAAKLLEVADRDVLPVIAIGLFAGLRPTEVWRLTWSDIIWHKNQIDVHGSTSKTARYRFVTIPQNLVEWLAPYRSASGRIWKGSQPNLNKRITAAGKAAGIASWPKDGLRHSFGSHHLAAHNNAPLTAKEMGHRDTDMLFKHYNNRRSSDEGAAYFAIRPLGAAEREAKICELAAA